MRSIYPRPEQVNQEVEKEEEEEEEEKRTDLKRRKRAGEAAELTHDDDYSYSYWQHQRSRSPLAVRHALLLNDNPFDDGPPNNSNNAARPSRPYLDQAVRLRRQVHTRHHPSTKPEPLPVPPLSLPSPDDAPSGHHRRCHCSGVPNFVLSSSYYYSPTDR